MTETTRPPGVAFYGKVRIPTIGHKKAIDKAQGIAKKTGGQMHIGLSGASHPLTIETKKAHAQAVFGHPVETGVSHTSNLFSYLSHLSQHHDDLHLVAGSDRAPEYRKTLQQWNGKADRNGKVAFNFKRWKVHEVEGERVDSDKHPSQMNRDELERTVSATKVEKLARGGDYAGFKAYHPGLPEKHVKKVYDQIRMAPTEATKPKSVKAIKAKVVKEEEEESAGQYWQKNPPPESAITRAASNLPVISQAKAVQSAVSNVRQGKYGSAALDIAAEIPKIGAAVGVARGLAALREDEVKDIGELDHEKFGPMLDSFVQFSSKKLGIKSMPTIQLQKGEMQASSFGGYNPQNQSIVVVSKNRHPMDIFRTVAHELVHHKQKEDGRIGKDISNEGATGSPFENEANAEAGKVMRWFAQKNPEIFKSGYVVEETQLTEGINDPGTFKAVFLAGGPGSGKDYVMKQTLDGMGLQEINSDVAFEYLMKKAGLNFKMPESERIERDIARGKAKKLTKERERLSLAGRRGLIINGTADDPEKIATIKKELEQLGYDTMMVFVNTSDEVSKERNIGRGEQGGRTVPEDIRKDKWDSAQAARPVFEKLFGKSNFVEIDNSNDLRTAPPEVKKKVEGEFQSIFKMAKKFVARQPIENEKAATWTQSEMQKRNMQSFVPPSSTSFGTGSVQRGAVQSIALPADQDSTQTTNQAPTSDELTQAQRLGLTYYGFGRYGQTIKGKHTVTYISQNGKLVPKQQQVAEDLRKWFSSKDPEGGWKRINSKGEAIGPCAREPGEPKPKCMSNEKRAKLSKKERASAVAAKRRHDPNPERKGEPINVSNFGKGKISEACWTGYEQRGTKKKGNRVVPNCVPVKESNAAAIAAATAIAKKKSGNYDKDGLRVKPYKNPDAPNVKSNDERRREMKKEEYLQEKNVPTNPQLWSRAKAMAKSKFDVYPSAYANGWASKWYKSKGGGWKTQADESFEHMVSENKPADREFGTTSLTNIYKAATPGQTFPTNPLFEKMNKKKIVSKAKKLAQEDNSLALGYEFGNNGIGQEFGVVRSPNGLGYGYSLPMDGGAYRMSESVENWMNKESTIERYIEKYGQQAERKLYEAAVRLSQLEETNNVAKGFDNLREAWEALGGRDMGTVAKQGSKEEMPEQSVMAAYMPHKADYTAKFDVEDPKTAAQYDKMRSLKHAHAQEYESQHSEKSMIGDRKEPRAAKLKEESAAWQRKEGKNPEGGLNKKGIESYRRENPGSKLSLAVTTKPSKLKKGSKAANRRKSFCARMGGMKKRLTSAKTANDPNSRINKSLRKWNCEE